MLTKKTGNTPHVQGFFAADFRPTRVIIVRPSLLGEDATYLLTEAGNGR